MINTRAPVGANKETCLLDQDAGLLCLLQMHLRITQFLLSSLMIELFSEICNPDLIQKYVYRIWNVVQIIWTVVCLGTTRKLTIQFSWLHKIFELTYVPCCSIEVIHWRGLYLWTRFPVSTMCGVVYCLVHQFLGLSSKRGSIFLVIRVTGKRKEWKSKNNQSLKANKNALI